MLLLLIRILFFCLVPIGIFLLTKGIKLSQKHFSGEVVFEISYIQKSGRFTISKAGNYSIWLKGPLFKRTPIDQFQPTIYQEETKRYLHLDYPMTKTSSNNGSTGRMRLFNFYAPTGDYQFDLTSGSSRMPLEAALAWILPKKPADLSKFYMEIKESKSSLYLIGGILLIIFSAFCIIGGFAAGMNVEKIIQ